MSRSLAIFTAACALLPAPAFAQVVYGPVEEEEPAVDLDEPIVRANPCETQAQQEGVILVCRELEDAARYRSPIPREVRSDRTIIDGITVQPCWVTHPHLLGTPACMRFGYVPEPAIMVDVTAFPEPLSAEDAALVSRSQEGPELPRTEVGERVAIDLSEDD